MISEWASSRELRWHVQSDALCDQGFLLKISAEDISHSQRVGSFRRASWVPALDLHACDLLPRTYAGDISVEMIKKYLFKPYMGGALRSSASGRDILLCGGADGSAELSLYAAAPDGWCGLAFLTTRFTDEEASVVGLSSEHLEFLAWSVLDRIIEGIAGGSLSVAS